MLEQKQGQFWNLHRIPNKTSNPDFRLLLFLLQFFSGLKKINCNFYSKIFPHQKNKTKIENRDSKFWAEFDADSKTVLVFFLALIVFDFYSFEGSKTHFTGETNIYIHICIYWVLLGGFDAINASNQRTIWSCMIFQHSWFVLYFFYKLDRFLWNFL